MESWWWDDRVSLIYILSSWITLNLIITSFTSPPFHILEHNLEEVPENVIIECAEICKAGTKYRNLKNLKVDYCQCSNVIKGDVIGEAIFRSNRRVKIIKLS